MMQLTSRKYPRTIDAEGVTRRDGVRLAWRDLKDIRPVYVNYRLNHVRLLFTSGDVGVFFKAFANGAEVLDFVRAITRQSIPFSLRRAT
jgi:hypothetical protein